MLTMVCMTLSKKYVPLCLKKVNRDAKRSQTFKTEKLAGYFYHFQISGLKVPKCYEWFGLGEVVWGMY